MLKLNLLIADYDQAYVERLTHYLNNHESHRFSISCVTSEEAMEIYLRKRGNHLDIALVHPSLSKTIGKGTTITTVLLSDGRVNILDKGKHTISKFMRGDLIASKLIDIYTEAHPEHMYLNRSNESMKSIAVFSPLGGVGKSLISAAIAITARNMGKETFYLNLEDGCSTSCYFNGDGFPSVSELIYYLKEKQDQVNAKIDSLAFKDPATGVKSFAPPEALTDIAELTEKEIEQLILNVMQTSNDLVIMDLTNQLSAKNMKALELAHEILLIGVPTPAGKKRMDQFVRHLAVMEKRKMCPFCKKSIL